MFPGRPEDLLDWAVLAYLALGAWYGWRRGLVASVVGLVSYGVGLAAAALYTGPLLQAANAAWGVDARLSAVLSRWLATSPLTAQAAAGGGLLASAMAAVGGGSPVQAADRLSAQVAHAVLGYAAFLLILLAVHAAAATLGAALTPKRLPLSSLNATLGLAFGAAEHALVAAVALSLVASFGGVAVLHGLSAGIQASPWARALEGALYHTAPQVARWLPPAAGGA